MESHDVGADQHTKPLKSSTKYTETNQTPTKNNELIIYTFTDKEVHDFPNRPPKPKYPDIEIDGYYETK